MLQTLPPLAAIRQEIARRKTEHLRRELQTHATETRARCATFAGFVREAWKILEPENPLVWNWHLDVLCEHLEAISLGRLTPRLIVNIPPGSSKSMIVSVMWQAWEWGPLGRRATRFLTTSFELENVKRDTRKTRDLIMSEWYQSLWQDVALIRTAELSFANKSTGTREGVPFHSIMGKRGDKLVVDDPHSLKGAESEADRGKAVRLFLEGGLNRLNNQTLSAIVIVMQRVHELDLTGALLAKDIGFIHLCLPMEFEVDNACITPLGRADRRTYDGELLDPVRFPAEAVEKLRKASAYAWAGQYQQRPAPREGGLFKRRWFSIVPAALANARRCRSWDLAASSQKGDWTVGARVSRSPDGFFYVEHVERFRGSAHEVENAILRYADDDGRAVSIRLPQDPGQAGKGQAEYLIRRLAGFNVFAERETGKKEVRASPLAAQCEAGNVKLVAGAWNDAFLEELENFPNGAHDDQVDAVSGAFSHLAATRGPMIISDSVLARAATYGRRP